MPGNVQALFKPHHLEPLIPLAKNFNSRIDVVHIYKDEPPVDGDRESILQQFPENMAAVHYFRDDDKGHGLISFAHLHGSDLVAVIERSRGFIIDLFHKSLSKNLALLTDLPLLVLHD